MPNYFIVVGRMHGDDEFTSVIVEATDYAAAVEAYHCEIYGLNDMPYDPDGDDLPDDGVGAIYIDAIFDCGDRRPVQQ